MRKSQTYLFPRPFILLEFAEKIRREWSGWQHFVPLPACPVSLDDGTITQDVVMRRKVRGKWSCRAATQEELAEFDQMRAW